MNKTKPWKSMTFEEKAALIAKDPDVRDVRYLYLAANPDGYRTYDSVESETKDSRKGHLYGMKCSKGNNDFFLDASRNALVVDHTTKLIALIK